MNDIDEEMYIEMQLQLQHSDADDCHNATTVN
jgi:hypothetical protein